MPPSQQDTTNLSGQFNIGRRILNSLLASVVGGSLVLGGGLYFNPGATEIKRVSIYYGSGSVLSYTGALLTGTGANGSFLRAWVRPPFTGTGVLNYVTFECYRPRAVIDTDLGVTTALTASGDNIWRNQRVQTGSLIQSSGTGTIVSLYQMGMRQFNRFSTGAIIVGSDRYLVLSTSIPAARTYTDCMLRS
jgi:hypothetical protein